MTRNRWLDIDRAMVGDVYTSNAAMETLAVLCDDFGARFVGTDGERRAAEFIADTFRDYGLTGVELEDYRYQGWTRGGTTVETVSPVERRLDAISLPYCPPATVRAPVVDVGCGTPEEFVEVGTELDGSIAMVHSSSPPRYPRWIHRKEKYDRAILAGAQAFLFVSEKPGLGPETGSLVDDGRGPIPGVSISYEEGALLERIEDRHGPVELSIETTDSFEERTSWNVSGELPGRDNPDETILLGSHYDGHDLAQGATDPASGTVVVVEAARVLAAHAPDSLARSVRFVAFGTEEVGLTGSRRYVDAHADELDRIRFMLNLDAVGAMDGRKGVSLHEWPELETFFEQAGEEMAAEFPVGQRLNSHSDHWPFFRAGVPSGWIGDPHRRPSGRGWGHTRFDTYDKVPVAGVREASANTARIALRLANAPKLPERRAPAEVETIIDEHPRLEDFRVARRLAAELGMADGSG